MLPHYNNYYNFEYYVILNNKARIELVKLKFNTQNLVMTDVIEPRQSPGFVLTLINNHLIHSFV